MRRFHNRGVVALEAEAGSISPEEVSSTDGPALDAAEAEAEVVESEAEGTEEIAAIDEGEAGAEALEVAVESLSLAAKNGGIDKHSAAAIGALTKHIYSRTGYRAKPMPSLESFGGTSTRIGATQLAMEGIKEGIKEIWKSIVAALKRVGEWIMGHLNKIFGGAEKMQKRAKSVAAAADAAGGKKIKNATFDNEALVKALYVGSAIPTALAAELGKAAAGVETYLRKNYPLTVKEAEAVVMAFEDPTKRADNVKLAAIPSAVTPAQKTALGEAGEGLNWNVSPELPGGMASVQRGPATEVSGLEAMKLFAKLRSGIVAMPGTKVPTSTKVTTLKTSDIEAIATVVEKLGSEVQDFRKVESNLKDVIAKATAAAEKAAAKSDTNPDEADKAGQADKESGKVVRSAAANIPKFIAGGVSSVTGYAMKVGQAALSLCEQSLKQYE